MFVKLQNKFMKLSNIKFLIFLFSFLIILSCSKDDDTDETINDPRAENIKGLGVSAEDLLSDAIYDNLVVEFAFTAGYRPLQETIDTFRVFLEERLYKPGSITFIETEIITPFVPTQSIADIRELEADQRTKYTDGNTIAIFVYFSHANFESDTETTKTLGTAYYNTSLVVFEQTLRELNSSPQYDLFILEATTLQHEFGHLLGLVNLRDDDIHENHEDPAHSNHCIVEECLMYFESNKSQSLRNRSSILELDSLCIEDLQAKGGK